MPHSVNDLTTERHKPAPAGWRLHWRLAALLAGTLLNGAPSHLLAQTLTHTQARQIANTLIQSETRSLPQQPEIHTIFTYQSPTTLNLKSTNPDTQTPAIYIATFSPTGFVILDALNPKNPVIGWSTNSPFPTNPSHPLLDFLLNQWHSPAKSTPADGSGTQIVNGKSSMVNSPAFSTNFIPPLIPAKWGQDDPWNLFCPAGPDSIHAPAGCVAVAMAQLMKRWAWPDQGVGSNRYTPPRHPQYGPIFADFSAITYRFDKMDPIWPMNATALLIFHSGVAAFMNYGPDESSTTVEKYALDALKKNFLYHPAAIYLEKEDFSDIVWLDMLQRELVNNRPLLYQGKSPDGRTIHAFNIDGYRDREYFHFNWGWTGIGNGWYRLDGMAGGSSNFSKDQGAIFSCQPSHIPLHDRPANLHAMPGNGFVKLIWDNPLLQNRSHFIILRDGDTLAQTIQPTFTDDSVQNGRVYQYQVITSYLGQTPGDSPPTPPQVAMPWDSVVMPYLIGFEEGLRGWSSTNLYSGFTVDRANELGFGNNAGMITGINASNYPTGTHLTDHLISPIIYPPDTGFIAVSFDYILRQKSGIDGLKLLWRSYDDAVWNLLADLDSTNSWSDWRASYHYLPAAVRGKPVQIAFYYNDFHSEGLGCALDNIRIYEVPEKPIPGFAANQTDNCLGNPVTFTDTTQGQAHTWSWNFGEGATPRTKMGRGPHQVQYSVPGPKEVSLLVNNLDLVVKPDYINTYLQPMAGFEYQRDALRVAFTSHVANAGFIWWDFGDGNTSNDPNPVHDFRSKRIFNVTQVVYNGSCPPDTAIVAIDLRAGTGIDIQDNNQEIKIFPNPAGKQVTIQWATPPTNPVRITLLSLEGRTLLSLHSPPQTEIELDLLAVPAGFYILRVGDDRQSRTFRFIKADARE
ncbi:MAG: C10 family peptidase [Bacteroidales bacterium]